MRTLALILSILFGTMVLVSACSPTPRVEIPQVASLDDGTLLEVRGLLVDFHSYDSGTENLVVMDPRTGMSIKVICSGGVGPSPNTYIRIGDELSVKGQTSVYKSSVAVLTDNDGITVLRKAEFVLTVELLSSNWVLFEGDEFVIRGILMQNGNRLYDRDMEHSIIAKSEDLSISQFDDKEVVLACRLQFDESIMALALVVDSIRLG